MALARETGLVVGAQVMLERSFEQMQHFADSLPTALRYCTDAFTVYQDLIWPGVIIPMVLQIGETIVLQKVVAFRA